MKQNRSTISYETAFDEGIASETEESANDIQQLKEAILQMVRKMKVKFWNNEEIDIQLLISDLRKLSRYVNKELL